MTGWICRRLRILCIYIPTFPLHLVGGPEYSSGRCREWDVDPKCPDLDISLAALNIEEPRSGIGNTSTSPHSVAGHASSSIFHDEDEE